MTRIGCGVFAAINHSDQPVFPYVYWGLRAQNHRGHQSHGFLTYENEKFYIRRNLDLVPKIKTDALQEWFGRLPGNIGIGNVRYTTSGKSDHTSLVRGTQPVTAEKNDIRLAVSFNGNVVNTFRLREDITKVFPRFSCECDADLICHKLLIEMANGKDLKSSVEDCLREIEGAFSVTGITNKGEFFSFKDPNGIRPLCAGQNSRGTVHAFSSETVGLDINSIKRCFELSPGELVTVSRNGFHRNTLPCKKRKAFCAFEFAYFARPDSVFDERYVYEIREELGRKLVRDNQDVVKDADMILSLPETGDDAAMGVHEESGLKWERASRRHRYVTERAFILLNSERYSTLDRKINILGSKIRGKKVIVIDDSIVRGDTTKVTVERLRKMGAKKVNIFATFPCIIAPCFYGIDMATFGQLIGARHEVDKIAEILGADNVRYQSIEGFVESTGFQRDELCLGCTTRRYPTPLAQRIADQMKKRFTEGYQETGRLYELAEALEE